MQKFKMSSNAGVTEIYPTTENWQKTIGTHWLWGEAEVSHCKNKYSMDITIYAIDRYNFNKGQYDIATGAPDNENGRFEVLGWAKSFTTRGNIAFNVEWEKGTIGQIRVAPKSR